jgi:hypothetical protein
VKPAGILEIIRENNRKKKNNNELKMNNKNKSVRDLYRNKINLKLAIIIEVT